MGKEQQSQPNQPARKTYAQPALAIAYLRGKGETQYADLASKDESIPVGLRVIVKNGVVLILKDDPTRQR